ncbi:hypothetical protein M885DRAFT_617955 [Pelagophyceae sp. CCMP2097]|nr:hypothetical protein M885DRAFT_617955 [Pelagophyceae sp. CCMP2097]
MFGLLPRRWSASKAARKPRAQSLPDAGPASMPGRRPSVSRDGGARDGGLHGPCGAYFHQGAGGAWLAYDEASNSKIADGQTRGEAVVLETAAGFVEVRFSVAGIVQVDLATDRAVAVERRARCVAAPVGDARQSTQPAAADTRRADFAARRHSGVESAALLVQSYELSLATTARAVVGEYIHVDAWGSATVSGGAVVVSRAAKRHRLVLEGGGQADVFLRCKEQDDEAAAQPYRLILEAPAWAVSGAIARARAERPKWRTRCDGALEQLELTLFAGRGLEAAGVSSDALCIKVYAQLLTSNGASAKASVRARRAGGRACFVGEREPWAPPTFVFGGADDAATLLIIIKHSPRLPARRATVGALVIPLKTIAANQDGIFGWLPLQRGCGDVQIGLYRCDFGARTAAHAPPPAPQRPPPPNPPSLPPRAPRENGAARITPGFEGAAPPAAPSIPASRLPPALPTRGPRTPPPARAARSPRAAPPVFDDETATSPRCEYAAAVDPSSRPEPAAAVPALVEPAAACDDAVTADLSRTAPEPTAAMQALVDRGISARQSRAAPPVFEDAPTGARAPSFDASPELPDSVVVPDGVVAGFAAPLAMVADHDDSRASSDGGARAAAAAKTRSKDASWKSLTVEADGVDSDVDSDDGPAAAPAEPEAEQPPIREAPACPAGGALAVEAPPAAKPPPPARRPPPPTSPSPARLARQRAERSASDLSLAAVEEELDHAAELAAPPPQAAAPPAQAAAPPAPARLGFLSAVHLGFALRKTAPAERAPTRVLPSFLADLRLGVSLKPAAQQQRLAPPAPATDLMSALADALASNRNFIQDVDIDDDDDDDEWDDLE